MVLMGGVELGTKGYGKRTFALAVKSSLKIMTSERYTIHWPWHSGGDRLSQGLPVSEIAYLRDSLFRTGWHKNGHVNSIRLPALGRCSGEVGLLNPGNIAMRRFYSTPIAVIAIAYSRSKIRSKNGRNSRFSVNPNFVRCSYKAGCKAVLKRENTP